MNAATTVPHSASVLAVDLAGNVTYVNRAAELMTGRTRLDLLGHSLEHLFETIGKVPQELPAAPRRSPGEVHHARASDARVLDRRAWPWIFIEFSSEPIHDRDGLIAGAIIVFWEAIDRAC